MQWTVQATVALLNLVWIVLFLQPDPFSVSVRKRSTDEEILIGEFCVRPHSGANWTPTVQTVNRTSDETNNGSKTADAGREINFTLYEDKTRQDRNQCCLKFSKRIPLRSIKEIFIIFDPFCHPNKANIIVTTVRGRRLCIDPSSRLGKFILRKIQRENNKAA